MWSFVILILVLLIAEAVVGLYIIFFGETGKERGERVYREYEEWQKKQEQLKKQ